MTLGRFSKMELRRLLKMVLRRFSTLWPDVLWIRSCHVFSKWWLDMYWKRYWDVFPNGNKTFSENGIEMFLHMMFSENGLETFFNMVIRRSLDMILGRFPKWWLDMYWKRHWDVFPNGNKTFSENNFKMFFQIEYVAKIWNWKEVVPNFNLLCQGLDLNKRFIRTKRVKQKIFAKLFNQTLDTTWTALANSHHRNGLTTQVHKSVH